MNTVYTQTTYDVANPIISLGRWEFILYLAIAFFLGYFIHYIFSSRRDYVRAPRNDNYYYPNTEPIYPPHNYHR